LQTVTGDEDVTLSKVSQRNNDGHCDGVTLWKPSIEEKRFRQRVGASSAISWANLLSATTATPLLGFIGNA
jgi:hypothetical protein